MHEKHGFTNIDALDGCEGILDILRKKGHHKEIILHWIDDNKIPKEDGKVLIYCICMSQFQH